MVCWIKLNTPKQELNLTVNNPAACEFNDLLEMGLDNFEGNYNVEV